METLLTKFQSFISRRLKRCIETLTMKRKEYTDEVNPFINFECGAKTIGEVPEKVMFYYMLKHFESFKDIVLNQRDVSKEVWDEKVSDLINYILIIDAYYQIYKYETENKDLSE